MIMTIYGITNSPKKCVAVEGMLSYRSLTHTMFRLILHRNTLLLSLSKMPKKWYRWASSVASPHCALVKVSGFDTNIKWINA